MEIIFESTLSYRLGCIISDEVAARVKNIDFAKVDDRNVIKAEGDEVSISIFKEMLATNLNQWRYVCRTPLAKK